MFLQAWIRDTKWVSMGVIYTFVDSLREDGVLAGKCCLCFERYLAAAAAAAFIVSVVTSSSYVILRFYRNVSEPEKKNAQCLFYYL